MFDGIRYDFDSGYWTRSSVAVLVASAIAATGGTTWLVTAVLTRIWHFLLQWVLLWLFPPGLVYTLAPNPVVYQLELRVERQIIEDGVVLVDLDGDLEPPMPPAPDPVLTIDDLPDFEPPPPPEATSVLAKYREPEPAELNDFISEMVTVELSSFGVDEGMSLGNAAILSSESGEENVGLLGVLVKGSVDEDADWEPEIRSRVGKIEEPSPRKVVGISLDSVEPMEEGVGGGDPVVLARILGTTGESGVIADLWTDEADTDAVVDLMAEIRVEEPQIRNVDPVDLVDTGSPGGVEGGVEGGVPGGVIGGVVGGIDGEIVEFDGDLREIKSERGDPGEETPPALEPVPDVESELHGIEIRSVSGGVQGGVVGGIEGGVVGGTLGGVRSDLPKPALRPIRVERPALDAPMRAWLTANGPTKCKVQVGVKKGRVVRTVVADGCPPDFRQAAIKAAEKTRFTPTHHDGKPFEDEAWLHFEFEIQM